MPERFEHYDRVAVVTGSDSGIGEAIAVALAANGFDVGVTYRSDQAGAESTAAKVRAAGRRSEVRRLDLSRLPEASDVVDELAEALGGLGVLVNCAGTGISTPVVDTGYAQWRDVLLVDLDGPFCARSAPPAGWSPPAGAAASSTSLVCTSTPRGSAPARTARPRAAWAY
jgi:NAD(P)-dependent dehydrogenase (short-subunit alcohol dehydrogenase family)